MYIYIYIYFFFKIFMRSSFSNIYSFLKYAARIDEILSRNLNDDSRTKISKFDITIDDLNIPSIKNY